MLSVGLTPHLIARESLIATGSLSTDCSVVFSSFTYEHGRASLNITIEILLDAMEKTQNPSQHKFSNQRLMNLTLVQK